MIGTEKNTGYNGQGNGLPNSLRNCSPNGLPHGHMDFNHANLLEPSNPSHEMLAAHPERTRSAPSRFEVILSTDTVPYSHIRAFF